MKSLHHNKNLPFCLLILSILIQAFGTICTKYAAEAYDISITILLYFVIIGGMGLQVFVWQYSLKYYPLSFAYPFRSLVNFIVVFAAFVLFQEPITLMKILGLTVITVGVFFLTRDMGAF